MGEKMFSFEGQWLNFFSRRWWTEADKYAYKLHPLRNFPQREIILVAPAASCPLSLPAPS